MKPHLVTITELARKKDGEFTHSVRLPGWIHFIHTESLADARKVAAGYQPRDGRPIQIREKLRTLTPSVRIPL